MSSPCLKPKQYNTMKIVHSLMIKGRVKQLEGGRNVWTDIWIVQDGAIFPSWKQMAVLINHPKEWTHFKCDFIVFQIVFSLDLSFSSVFALSFLSIITASCILGSIKAFNHSPRVRANRAMSNAKVTKLIPALHVRGAGWFRSGRFTTLYFPAKGLRGVSNYHVCSGERGEEERGSK